MSNYSEEISILSVTGFSSGARLDAVRAARQQRIAWEWPLRCNARKVRPLFTTRAHMILEILKHTPIWVWLVFAAIVLLGLQQTRTRDVSIVRATVLPVVMFVLSLSGVLGAFAHVPLAGAAWAFGVGLSLMSAGKAVAARGASRSPEPGHLRVPGSLVPIALILAVFITKYAAGIALAINPSLATNARVAMALSLVYGGFSGLFLARAQSLRTALNGSL